MQQFLAAHRRACFTISAVFALLTASLLLTACAAPLWLTDASMVITMVGASFTSIASFIAGLTGNAGLAAALAVVSTWIGKVQTGLADIELLVEQYNQTKSPTVLNNIEAALLDVQTNVKQDFSNLGLPPAVLTVIAGIAGVALEQLIAWGTLIPSLNAKAMQTFEVTTPYTKPEFKAKINAFLTVHTGDPEIDAALAKAKKL